MRQLHYRYQMAIQLLSVVPEQDRSILLRAPVAIGATKFVLTAVRVDRIELSPDYRSDIKRHIYDEYPPDCRN